MQTTKPQTESTLIIIAQSESMWEVQNKEEKRAATETKVEVVCFKMKHTQKWREKWSSPYMALTIKQATHFKFLTSYKSQISSEVVRETT